MRRFNVSDQVRFVNTGTDELEGTTGTVLGFTAEFPDTHFVIVGNLSRPLSSGYLAIQMIEHCLVKET